MAYPKAEQETVLVFEAETAEWSAYSTVPKHIRKLQKIADVKVLEIDEHGNPSAARAVLDEKQVTMKKVRVYTEEQRKQMSERAKSILRSGDTKTVE